MIFKKEYSLYVFSILVILLMTGFSEGYPDMPESDFWSMEGTVIKHFFEDKRDSLSGPELFELQDENGLPIWFGRHIFKDVCISGKCKMIRLWLFWDGAGNYLGIETLNEEPLTKSDHTRFEEKDYRRLESILRDTTSILKGLKQEELIIVPDSIDLYEVDGYTAATQPTLGEVVVKDAVYTCYTLWHTVYGPVQKEVYKILENRTSETFIKKMLRSNNQEYISWAIESVRAHPEYHPDFYRCIMSNIESENFDLANQALNYFQPEMFVDTAIQLQLVRVMDVVDLNLRNEIIWKFIDWGNADARVIKSMLEMVIDGKLGIFSFNYILRLIKPEHLKEGEPILQLLTDLTNHDDIYIRNLAQRMINFN
ncbi:hypothetical protein INQ51_22145 [Maribellus sp. CM-23]|uniref:hypothetical protein n=1 Tax=Maribellus sp. CM-23 TaxID=2781026 RepID=UPI001F274984|nr:hypothetical protein [Maribellus sp. CM-23]MCE4567039.1 hypothetical protein [Maribellus sp. CM-23]